MKKLLMASLMLVSHFAVASTTADLVVLGTIAPSACDITVDGSTFDFGSISFGALNASVNTDLPASGARNLAIQCPSPVLLGFTVSDNRLTSIPGSMRSSTAFGLGSDRSGQPIGRYNINVPTRGAVVDGAQGWLHFATVIDPLRENWRLINDAGGQHSLNNASSGAAYYTLSNVPVNNTAVLHASIPLTVSPRISPTNTLDTTRIAQLDGSVVFGLFYM